MTNTEVPFCCCCAPAGPGERGRMLSALVLRRQAAQRQAADRRGANPVRLHCAGDREHRALQPQSQQLAAGRSAAAAASSRRHRPSAVGRVRRLVVSVVVVSVGRWCCGSRHGHTAARPQHIIIIAGGHHCRPLAVAAATAIVAPMVAHRFLRRTASTVGGWVNI